ncbi:MAG: helix-turn-helix domain-containing protein [Chloroflexota bacterium]|nr:helix-turn-helix domain-containing protein [Chloroflexota bacterium]
MALVLLTVKEVSEQIDRPLVTVYRMVKANDLHGVKVRGILYVDAVEVERYINAPYDTRGRGQKK